MARYIKITEAMRLCGIKSRTTWSKLCIELDIHVYDIGGKKVLLSEIQDKILSTRKRVG